MRVEAHITMELQQLRTEIPQLEQELRDPSEEVQPAPKAEKSSHNLDEEAAAELKRARVIVGRPLPARSYDPVEAPRQSLFEFFSGNPALLMLVGAATLVIFLLASTPARSTFRNFLDRRANTPTQVSELQYIYGPGEQPMNLVTGEIVSLTDYTIEGGFVYL
jgi:hypothetical protein